MANWLQPDEIGTFLIAGAFALLEGQLDDADEETLENATTPVKRIDGPILFISGAHDPIWPARRLTEIAVERLEESAFEHESDHLTYGEAGHFVTPPYLPKSHHVFGGTPAGMAAADADSWPAVLDYLARGLR